MAISQTKRKRLIKRDHGVCSYCGSGLIDSEICIDHVKPIARLGKNNDQNLTVSCRTCNSMKGKKSVIELYEEFLPRDLRATEKRLEHLKKMMQYIPNNWEWK